MNLRTILPNLLPAILTLYNTYRIHLDKLMRFLPQLSDFVPVKKSVL